MTSVAGSLRSSGLDMVKRVLRGPMARLTAVHRLRAQFRELLCEQVLNTLGNDDLLEDEIRHLFAALSV